MTSRMSESASTNAGAVTANVFTGMRRVARCHSGKLIRCSCASDGHTFGKSHADLKSSAHAAPDRSVTAPRDSVHSALAA